MFTKKQVSFAIPAPSSRSTASSRCSSHSSSLASSSPFSQAPSQSSSQTSSDSDSQDLKACSQPLRRRLRSCLRIILPARKCKSSPSIQTLEKPSLDATRSEPCEVAPSATNTDMRPPMLTRFRKRMLRSKASSAASRSASASSCKATVDLDWLLVPRSVAQECKTAKFEEVPVQQDDSIPLLSEHDSHAESLKHTSDFVKYPSTLSLHCAPSVSSSDSSGCYMICKKLRPSAPSYDKPLPRTPPYDEQSVYEAQLLLGLSSLRVSDTNLKEELEIQKAARVLLLLGTPRPSISSGSRERPSSLNTIPKQVPACSDAVDVANCSLQLIEAARILVLLGGRSIPTGCPQQVESSLDAGDCSFLSVREGGNNSSEDEESISERTLSVPSSDEQRYQEALLLLGLSSPRIADDEHEEEQKQQSIQLPISYCRTDV